MTLQHWRKKTGNSQKHFGWLCGTSAQANTAERFLENMSDFYRNTASRLSIKQKLSQPHGEMMKKGRLLKSDETNPVIAVLVKNSKDVAESEIPPVSN